MKPRTIMKWAGIGLAAALAIAAAKALGIPELLRGALARIDGLGPWGPAAFIALYIAATVLLLPGSILTLGAGAVFGAFRGSIYVSAASTMGATAAFLVGRYLARDRVVRKLQGNARFRAVDGALKSGGWWIVLLLRLSPVFPFNLLNYALGLTDVKLRDYFLASWLGMLPGTIMYVYIGSLAGDLAGLGAGGRVRTPTEWALYGVGLTATVAVTLYVTRIARSALRQHIEPSNKDGQ